MKKILVSILIMLYLSSFSGIAMDIQYCMGKQIGIEFFHYKEGKCPKCSMKAKKKCCNDEYKFFKLKDDHKNVSNILLQGPISVIICTKHVHFINDLFENNPLVAFNNNSPPLYSPGSFICIKNGVFRL